MGNIFGTLIAVKLASYTLKPMRKLKRKSKCKDKFKL